MTVDCAYDVLQASGEKIEFGERRELTLRRPDRARFDVMRRDGTRRGIVFDGRQLTVFDLDAKVYAALEKPGIARRPHFTPWLAHGRQRVPGDRDSSRHPRQRILDCA